ncbi:MAG: DUF1844 domain-containing protein [Endomicrobiaceae bacterium]|jgi:hypothetical protein|nr:DUF1844 domain-containing protein [Endomicrobiaceae bacterium]
MDPKELNQHLFSLVSMFASACWQQIGKIPNQIDGKITKDLKSAQVTIDMLLMLRDKMKGNLTVTEEKFLTDTISNLQINYADEAAKGDNVKDDDKKEEPAVQEKK